MLNLDEIRARNRVRAQVRARATPGPWYVHYLDDMESANLVAVSTQPEGEYLHWSDPKDRRKWPHLVAATLVQYPAYVRGDDDRWDENARFIAFARNDDVDAEVDALVAEVERLRRIADEALLASEGLPGNMPHFGTVREKLAELRRELDT